MKWIILSLCLVLGISLTLNILLVNTINHYKHEDLELKRYEKMFLELAGVHNCKLKKIKVNLSFGKLAHIYIGKDSLLRKATTVKRWPYFLQNEIIVDVDWYRKSTPIQREQTLFHELAHVYLGRGHLNLFLYKDRQLIPVSMMNRTNTQYYEKYKEYYLKELFENGS